MTIRTSSSKQTKIKTTEEKQRRISLSEFGKAIGAEPTGVSLNSSDPYIAGQSVNLLKTLKVSCVPVGLITTSTKQVQIDTLEQIAIERPPLR